MKYILSLFPLVFILTTTTVNATDYHYCNCLSGASNLCSVGNDSSAGTTADAPRKTFANARTQFNSMAAGDSIKFCRGGSFSAGNASGWVNNNSTSTLPVTVTAYTPPTTSLSSRPIVIQANDSRLFNFTASGNQQGYVFSNLDLRCIACNYNGSSSAFFFYSDIDNVTLDNISIDGFRIGIQLAALTQIGVEQDNITIRNITSINNKTQGILGGANNFILEDSYFANNGGGTVFDHNIYLSRGNNIIVRNNELYKSSVNANNECNGVSFVVHSKGTIDTLLIEGNTIREDVGKATTGCWGITVDPGYAGKDEGFLNVTLRGNKVINVGNLGIGVASCRNCIIENNIVLHEQSHKITAIGAPNRTREATDLSMDNITVRNNSIYIGPGNSGSTGIRVGSEGNQHSVISNAIHYTGTGDFNCVSLDLPTSAYSAIDNNVCYFPNASSGSEWKNGSGNQTPVGSNSKNANPMFTSPGLPQVDFSLQAASAARNAGHSTLSAAKDFRGKTRDSQPDAGALEFGTFNPPAKTNLYLN